MVKVDYKRDKYLSKFSIKTLEDRYLLEGEKSPQDAFARAAQAFADDDDHAQRLYDYASKLWFMFSTPILSNGGSTRGLPISCFLNYAEDSRQGLTGHYKENAFLSSVGGGIGGRRYMQFQGILYLQCPYLEALFRTETLLTFSSRKHPEEKTF